ncbi:thymidine phosphorylase-like [Ruditapes philippinarum]|uniref:thymidine phosphorylase-like n=1 Tax=Ruditapes philippinarum TaxID=129788 RepID=UPI00295B50CC|nr:thymidine phosphorylase-like [Ruditapes philippinarum]
MAQQHTGGALDRLESIPGFHIMQEDTDMRQILNDVGCCIVSQTSQLIPADRIMYAVRNDTTTEHEHCLITGSVISKKAVESQDSVGFDLGCETGTFYEDGQVIKMVKATNSLQIKTITLLTDLSSPPLGKTFGNALEVAESIQCLQGKGPKDLTELVKYLGGQLLVSLKKALNLEQAYEMIDDTLSDDKSDNSAIVKFKAMIEAQGVDQYYAKRLCDKKTDVFGILLSASVCTTEIQAKTSGCIQGINVLTCKKVMETLRSCAEKIRNSDGNTVGLKVLVNIGDAIEEGWPWIKIYHNGELSGELVKDIDGAIEIYQDPTEPNKRRTDYENEEESKEHTKKKEEFSDIRIKEIKVQASEFPRYEYALGNLLDVVMRYKVFLQSNCIGHDGRYILFYICTSPENDKMIDDFLQEITKKGEIRDGGSLEQFVQSKDQPSVSCFITPENYHHILTAIRHRTTMSFILCETDLEEKAKRYQNTYAIQKNNAWKQIDSVLEKWLFQSLKPVCSALGGDIERNLSDKNATNRDVYEEKPITDDEQTNETNVIIFLKKDMLSTL